MAEALGASAQPRRARGQCTATDACDIDSFSHKARMNNRIPMKRLAGLAALMACAWIPASEARAADPKDIFEARVFEGVEGAKLNYRLMKPAEYDAKRKYPLVLFLHGAGERGDDNVAQLIHGMADFSSDENRKKYPCFVVAPQCPANRSWGGFRRAANAEDKLEPGKLLVPLIDALKKEFSVDADRLYVTGLSMGGFGTWELIGHHPDVFAAAAPICGGGDEKFAERLVKLPIWAFHGAKDTVVKPEGSRTMIDAIRKAGGKPLYTEYEDVGHDSWVRAYHDPKLMEWMFAQKRP
jgi:predicted peptidase